MAGKRILWLDSLRGFALFFVILGHACTIPPDCRVLIFSFHMPLFFAISGAVFRYGKYTTVTECIIDKAKALLLPYVLLYLVNIPLKLVSFGVFNNTWYSATDYVIGFFTGCVYGASTSWPLWLLPCLFLTSVLYWVFAHAENKCRIPLWVSTCVLFLVGIAIWELIPSKGIWHWKTVPMALLFFHLGHMFMKHRTKVFAVIGYSDETNKPCRAWFYPLMVALLLIGLGLGLHNGSISMFGNIYRNYAITVISASCTSVALAMFIMALPTSKMLDFAGKNSLGFFGLHRNLLHGLEYCSFTYPLLGSNPLIASIVVWAVLFPICAFSNKYFPPLSGQPRLSKQEKQ